MGALDFNPARSRTVTDVVITHAPIAPLIEPLTDAELLDAAATTIAIPRDEPADSFVLHAPLELLARAGLLPHVESGRRGTVIDRMHDVARGYQAWGTPLDREPEHSAAVTDDPVGVLAAALSSGDAEAADDAITWIADRFDTEELVRALAEPVLPSLAAAGHGPILLFLLQRVATRSRAAAAMTRSTMHELVRHPDWKLSWFDDDATAGTFDAEAELVRRLVSPTLPEQPENPFIHPTMSATERTGVAAETLADLTGGLTVPAARRALLRTAALSMLQDDPQHAPYGWSHCLTMPQAALGIARATPHPTTAIAVAATYVLGFRASLGSVAIDATWAPDPATIDVNELIAAGPVDAAAAAWHATPDLRPAVWRTLAAHAGGHRDAHLAKYTLACLDAVRADPDAEAMFIAAAAFLNAWWAEADRAA